MPDDVDTLDGKRCYAPVQVYFTTIGLSQKIIDVFGNDVDDLFLERVGLRDRNAAANRLDRPFSIPATLLRDSLAKRGGEIFDLFTHHPFDFLSSAGYRMSRADIGGRRHRRNMRSHGNKNPRRSSTGAAGRYMDHDRNLSAEHLLDDGPGRAQKAAGSIELNDQRAGSIRFRPDDALANKIIHCRIDRTIDYDQIHVRR